MKKAIQALNIVAFIAMVYVNYLSNSLPINGKTPGQLSDDLPNLFVPAGITFSIWGVVYLFLLGFVIYQAAELFDSEAKGNAWFSKIGILFVLTCATNIGWIFAWHFQYILPSVIIMLSFLGLLIAIYQRLGIGRVLVTTKVKWFVHVPFSIYLGWISVATIANITAYLVSIGWDGFGIAEEYYAIFLIMTASYLGQKLVNTREDIAYGFVIVWALVGIFIKQNAQSSTYNNTAIAAIIGIVLVLLYLLPAIFRKLNPA